MTPFESPYFDLMPAEEDVIECLGELGIRTVHDVRLFRFSSCTPAFCVEIENSQGTSERLVLRGEQQNDLRVPSPAERSMEKEIYMLNTVRNLGLNAAEPLHDGRIFAVPGYDRRGNSVGNFRFFLMEYVEGIAIDRKVHASSGMQRLRLLDQIAEIYARIHSVEGGEFGLVDRDGCAVGGHATLHDFLLDLLKKKAAITAELLNVELADEIHRFCDTVIATLWEDIQNTDYKPQPRLILYDGFCGNMLIQGDKISLIDMALAGYFEPVTEFCTFIYPLRTLLLQREKQGRYWDHFINSYLAHGGTLPPTNVMIGLLHVMFVNLLLHQLVYCVENRGQDKQGQVGFLCETVSSMMAEKSQTIEDLCRFRESAAA